MARYDYRCQRCGGFESACSVGTAPARQPCPVCREASARVWSAAALLPGRTTLTRAVEADRRSAAEPAVVTVPPRQRRAVQPRSPLQVKLPRL